MPDETEENMSIEREIKKGEPKEALSKQPRPVEKEIENAREELKRRGIEPMRGGAPWLYEKSADLDHISNPEARKKIEGLEEKAGAGLAREEAIRKTYLELNAMVDDDKVPLREIQDQMIKMSDRLDEMEGRRGETSRPERGGIGQGQRDRRDRGFSILPEIPTDPVEQRRMMIPFIEKIEATDIPLDEANIALVAEIEASFYKLEPSLAAECRARIKLHDCFSLVRTLSGDTETDIKKLGAISDKLKGRNHALEASDFEVLLKGGLKDLPVAEAFKKLERWGIEGRRFRGRMVRFNEKGSTAVEQEASREEIIRELGGDLPLARKSFQLAHRLAVATFETSVWNYQMQGSDVLAETIYLNDYRRGRAESGKDRGPDITLDKIPGFGTSFFRSAQLAREGAGFLLPRKTDRNKVKELLTNQRINEERGRREYTTLDFNKMSFSEMAEGVYRGYLGNYLTRILNTKALLLKTDFKPDEATEDVIMKWEGWFGASDPKDTLDLKKWLVAGIIDSGLNQEARLGWGYDEVARFCWAVVKKIGDKDGKPISFINKDEIRSVYKAVSEEEMFSRLIGMFFGSAWGLRWRGFKSDLSLSLSGVIRTKR